MLAIELNRSFLSKAFLTDEYKHLDVLKESLEGIPQFEKQYEFYENMQTILEYLKKFSGSSSNVTNSQQEMSRQNTTVSTGSVSLLDKIQTLVTDVAKIIEESVANPDISLNSSRSKFESLIGSLNGVWQDVAQVKNYFKSTLHQKRKLESEMLSVFHRFQEVRRLERELQEKRSHITELSKYGQLIRRKTRNHRRELEQIQINIVEKKDQLNDLQLTLERQLSSADMRLHGILELLPDLGEIGKEETFLSTGNNYTSHHPTSSQTWGDVTYNYDDYLKNCESKKQYNNYHHRRQHHRGPSTLNTGFIRISKISSARRSRITFTGNEESDENEDTKPTTCTNPDENISPQDNVKYSEEDNPGKNFTIKDHNIKCFCKPPNSKFADIKCRCDKMARKNSVLYDAKYPSAKIMLRQSLQTKRIEIRLANKNGN